MRVLAIKGFLFVVELFAELIAPGCLLEHFGQLLLVERQLLGVFVDGACTGQVLPGRVAGLDDQRVEFGIAYGFGQRGAVVDVDFRKVFTQRQQGDADVALGAGFTHVFAGEGEVDHFTGGDDFGFAVQRDGLRLLDVRGFDAVDVGVGDGQVVRVAQVGAGGAELDPGIGF